MGTIPPFEPAPDAALPQPVLRPLSTGELLDRVFFLYRSRPLLFWGVGLVPAFVGLLGGAAQLVALHGQLLPPNPRTPFAVYHSVEGASISLLSGVLALLAYALAQAAMTRVTMQLTLAEPVQASEALRAGLPRLPRYIGVELWKVGSAIWLPALFFIPAAILLSKRSYAAGGLLFLVALFAFIYGIIAYIRNSLGMPAAVVEGLGVVRAMKRSKQLVAGRKWRIFLLFLLIVALYLIGGLISTPLSLMLAHARTPARLAMAAAGNLVVSFLLSLLLTPVLSIGLCLFYFDERVRREGLDLDLLLRGVDAARATPVPDAAPPAVD